ncbi:MAG: Na+/H+ antiporter subunit E [Verrucomicrobia bacterium CG_4_10_14_3_um_filter_43_23]|nr:MAG: hypothetical protein AUJ82_04000 [Verrucomicrobia bacterium CG1_02_43_26]PIP58512.1 MAG: Na+/H+ antiporter subunit E [Verrucomicrobia bacterium CG22_combo_CG10-13_8_21_14_all_43_17]PIX58184.1 MAG: Na+/H+ antiporter subunit E [Verrucomicrobia bacterium CG_4_10_14_3_um_filter_43_23]PIY60837.1 MAG: Na+/H+ antiporter subunit E [Verrucomicrobia bacterium CG_4_10_14_0_8_um_filter_43_34]PJA44327.1 MAG: Na+/H+ antiporter subunit E [Verrucomicrobia bacterium CG_4_9_14_3_um_filter_43_20]
MILFLINILLAIIWTGLTGEISFVNFTAGFIFSYLILLVVYSRKRESSYFKKVIHVFLFFIFYVVELVLSNFSIAIDILTPRKKLNPGIIAFPLTAKTNTEITLVANLITMAPGEISLDVSEDKKYLYLHVVHIESVEKSIQSIQKSLEKRVLTVLQ